MRGRKEEKGRRENGKKRWRKDFKHPTKEKEKENEINKRKKKENK